MEGFSGCAQVCCSTFVSRSILHSSFTYPSLHYTCLCSWYLVDILVSLLCIVECEICFADHEEEVVHLGLHPTWPEPGNCARWQWGYPNCLIFTTLYCTNCLIFTTLYCTCFFLIHCPLWYSFPAGASGHGHLLLFPLGLCFVGYTPEPYILPSCASSTCNPPEILQLLMSRGLIQGLNWWNCHREEWEGEPEGV